MAFDLPPHHPPVPAGATGCPVASASSNLEAQREVDLAKLHGVALLNALSPSEPPCPHAVITLGTRMSKLAMVQTNLVKAHLEDKFPGVEVRIFGMTTSGDQNTSQPLYLLGGKALWTKELEVALLDGRVDAIVHSLKDVPTDFPPGCQLGAVLEREDPSDALVMKAGLSYTKLEDLPDGSVIGTSSVRRVAQLRRCFPKLRFADVRGLVQTRLRKLDDPESPYKALILASAGLIRLDLGHRITAAVTSPTLYHAVGQGAIGIEIRQGDDRAKRIVGALECWKTGWSTRAERTMLKVLEGGCSVPVGCETKLVEVSAAINGCPFLPAGAKDSASPTPRLRLATVDDPHEATITLTGTITSLAGTSSVISSITRRVHSVAEAEMVGYDVAQELIAGGGKEILTELGRHVKEVGGEEGKEVPFESNNLGLVDSHGRAAVNIPPPSAMERTSSYGTGSGGPAPIMSMSPKSPKSPHSHRTVFTQGEVCLRPAGW